MPLRAYAVTLRPAKCSSLPHSSVDVQPLQTLFTVIREAYGLYQFEPVTGWCVSPWLCANPPVTTPYTFFLPHLFYLWYPHGHLCGLWVLRFCTSAAPAVCAFSQKSDRHLQAHTDDATVAIVIGTAWMANGVI